MIEKVEIGNAILYNGDCLEVTKALEGRYGSTISDPPYEASMHTKDRVVKKAGGWGTETEAHSFAAMDETTRDLITKHVVENTDGWVLYFCQSEGAHYWNEAIKRHHGKYKFTGVWVKPSSKPNLSGDSPGLGYESIVGGWCGPGKSKWNGGGRPAVWTANPEKRSVGNNHTSIKPQKLMVELVELFSDTGDVVFDPFMGSGSTGVAAVSLGRKFVGIERDPEYFEICCRRIEEAQKGFFHTPYVKKKAQVAVALFPETPKAPKVTPPAPRGTPVPKAEKPAAAPRAPRTSAPKAAPRARFAAPAIQIDDDPEPARPRLPLPDPFKAIIQKHGSEMIDFGPWDDTPNGAVGMDVESFPNFFLVNFERFGNGQKLNLELSDRSDLDRARLRHILGSECVITFNGTKYDVPMVALALAGHDTYSLKEFSNILIRAETPPWKLEEKLGITFPRINHVDLYDPNPAIQQGLKVLNGRLHGRTMMDLPYPHDKNLTRAEMNVSTVYCFNDTDALKNLFNALREPLALRVALGKTYNLDLRSRSDAQVGEAIVKKRVEILTGRRIKKAADVSPFFRYEVPDFFRFNHPDILKAVEIIRRTEFSVNAAGHVEMPEELKNLQIRIGLSTYTMGIGGLHSTESNRAVLADNEYVLIDLDVASQYPRIILRLGMFPKAMGPAFLKVYGALVDERVNAKQRAAIIKREELPRAVEAKLLDLVEQLEKEMRENTVKAEGGKIAANGVFGKLMSIFSVLYAPNLGIATTLTGQLSLLMIIDMCEAAGISVVSANTDGVVLRCKRSMVEFDKDKNIVGGVLREVLNAWENATGFEFESNIYKAIYNSSVNTYIALKEDGGHKRKGPIANPWGDKDLRGQMMKNPQMYVCSDAVLEFLKKGTPIADTIRACRDPRAFITIINAKGGCTWRGGYLGKVARYYWSTDADPILYVKTTAKGSGRKVAKTDGAKPLMEMDGSMPDDVDYERYIKEAENIARDIGVEMDLLKEAA